MVESSPVVHAPLSLGCPSMRVCSMVMPLAFRLEADPCTEQPTTARKADVHCSHALWESWVVGVPVMPLAFRLEADLTRLLPLPGRPPYPPLDICFGQRLFSLCCKVAVSKCENAASLTALSLSSVLPAWLSLLGIGRDTIGVCCG